MVTEREKSYVVEGMTCEHCAAAVAEEVGRVPGVRSLDVDLGSGRLTVRGDDVDDAAVAGAVDEAGYAVAGAA